MIYRPPAGEFKMHREKGFFPPLQQRPEKAMATNSSTLAWKIPWMEEPGRLQSMALLRVEHDWATSLWLFTFMHWRRKWQPTPVFLPGESQGRGSLVGCRLWGSHRVRHDWSNLAAAAACCIYTCVSWMFASLYLMAGYWAPLLKIPRGIQSCVRSMGVMSQALDFLLPFPSSSLFFIQNKTNTWNYETGNATLAHSDCW